MKVKKGFMLREVAKNHVVVPVGKAAVEFNGIINLNETGAFLWGKLVDDTTLDSLIAALLDRYDISFDIAKKDVLAFVKTLEDADLLA